MTHNTPLLRNPERNVDLGKASSHDAMDQSLMVDLLNYFSFQPVFHDWCVKGRGMCFPVCGIVPINEPLLLIEKGSGFPL